jgi:glyoxylase-like metal-dependent hydrolase (beta-lactamase superfamily II)
MPPDVAAAVAPGVHRIRLPSPFPIGPLNSYLIEDEPLTLVDAGPNSASTYEALEDGLAELGYAVRDLGLILVTHQHLDHIGLVGLLARRSGANVAALDLLTPWLAAYDDSIAAQQQFTDDVMAAHGVPAPIRLVVEAMGRRGRGWGAPAHVTDPLVDGQELQLRDRTLTVRHRPGHSPSDTVFWDEQHKVMIGGDHLLKHVSSNPVITRPLAGPPQPRPQSLVTYLASMRATASEPVEVLLPGHGKPIEDHRELIETRVAMHDRRRDRLHGLIGERPRSAFELATELWGEEATRQAALTVSEVLGHIDLLLNSGDVFETQAPDGTIRFAVA